MAASAACGVFDTEASTSPIWCSGGIFAKSAGSDLPATKAHGPVSALALNQRPEIST